MTMNQRTVRKQLSQGLPTVCLPLFEALARVLRNASPWAAASQEGRKTRPWRSSEAARWLSPGEQTWDTGPVLFMGAANQGQENRGLRITFL